MPQVPNIAGLPTKMVQPPLSQVREPDPLATPEPAKTAADHIPPTQEQLAALSIAQQTIAKKNEMEPHILTPDERKEKAIKAVEARWSKRYNWEDADLDDALAYLAEIRLECERGGITLQKRVSELKVEKVKCFGCDNIINISEGRWATMRTRNNFETGIPETAFACSAACGLKLNREFTHPTRNAAIPVEREAEKAAGG